MKKLLLLAASLLLFPLSAHAQKNGAKDTVMVEINTDRGPASIPLVRKGEGFVGPRGEYYPTFPAKKTLAAVYGTSSSRPPAPTPKPNPVPVPVPVGNGEIKVVTVDGGVNIRENGKFLRQIRTARPEVRGWKLIRENTALVIKSGVGREPGIVELFEVRSGQLLERVKATSIKDGKPAWAKNFAE